MNSVYSIELFLKSDLTFVRRLLVDFGSNITDRHIKLAMFPGRIIDRFRSTVISNSTFPLMGNLSSRRVMKDVLVELEFSKGIFLYEQHLDLCTYYIQHFSGIELRVRSLQNVNCFPLSATQNKKCFTKL